MVERGVDVYIEAEVRHEIVSWRIFRRFLSGIPEVSMQRLSFSSMLKSPLNVTILAKVGHKVVHLVRAGWRGGPSEQRLPLEYYAVSEAGQGNCANIFHYFNYYN